MTAPTILMPLVKRLQDMLPLRLLAAVLHKSYRIVADRPRGSCQGFWEATCPARVLVVAGNEGIAASDNAGSRSIVGCHCKPLNSCVVSLKLLLHVTRNNNRQLEAVLLSKRKVCSFDLDSGQRLSASQGEQEKGPNLASLQGNYWHNSHVD